jgi:hypothetical protein
MAGQGVLLLIFVFVFILAAASASRRVLEARFLELREKRRKATEIELPSISLGAPLAIFPNRRRLGRGPAGKDDFLAKDKLDSHIMNTPIDERETIDKHIKRPARPRG